MKITDIKKGEIGTRFNPGTFTIKTVKNTWKLDCGWVNQVVIVDNTGEMLADVFVGKSRRKLQRNAEIKIIIAEIQEAELRGEPIKKLYVEQFNIPSMTADEYEADRESDLLEYDKHQEKVVRSKIACLIVSRWGVGRSVTEIEDFTKELLESETIKLIMNGE